MPWRVADAEYERLGSDDNAGEAPPVYEAPVQASHESLHNAQTIVIICCNVS